MCDLALLYHELSLSSVSLLFLPRAPPLCILPPLPLDSSFASLHPCTDLSSSSLQCFRAPTLSVTRCCAPPRCRSAAAPDRPRPARLALALAPRSPSPPRARMDPSPDFVLVFSLDPHYNSPVRGLPQDKGVKAKRAEQLRSEHSALVTRLKTAGFAVQGRKGAQGTNSLLLFVKADEQRVRQEATRERCVQLLDHDVARFRAAQAQQGRELTGHEGCPQDERLAARPREPQAVAEGAARLCGRAHRGERAPQARLLDPHCASFFLHEHAQTGD